MNAGLRISQFQRRLNLAYRKFILCIVGKLVVVTRIPYEFNLSGTAANYHPAAKLIYNSVNSYSEQAVNIHIGGLFFFVVCQCITAPGNRNRTLRNRERLRLAFVIRCKAVILITNCNYFRSVIISCVFLRSFNCELAGIITAKINCGSLRAMPVSVINKTVLAPGNLNRLLIYPQLGFNCTVI